jgi:pimeloyl-ACP methyl ester carboxylesterase
VNTASKAEVIEPVILPGEQTFTLQTENGQQLRGCFHDTGKGPVGIYLHGFRSHCNGDKALEIARHAIKRNRSWLRFDLRGHGQSDGELKDQIISSGLDDLLLVLDSITDRTIILHGSSMGGWISLLAALQRKQSVAGMMLIAPAFNFVQNNLANLPGPVLKHWQLETYMSFPDAYGNEPYSLRYDIIKDAEPHDVLNTQIALDIPVHIVHGEKDPIIPIINTEKFIHRAQIPALIYETIPDGEHRLTDHIPLIIRHIDSLWRGIYR